VASICALAAKLETGYFKDAWALASSLSSVTAGVSGFEAALRKCETICLH